MFGNVLINFDHGKYYVVTDCFKYDDEKHQLSYHSLFDLDSSVTLIKNVKCVIKVDRPIIYIDVQHLGVSNEM